MAGAPEKSAIYYFDGYCLDVQKRRVVGPDGKTVALKAKAFETLLFLVENTGRTVERDELLTAIWPDTVVEENNLTQHISSLRRMFGETPDDHRFIATVAGRGYQFVAQVGREEDRVGDGQAHTSYRRWVILLAGALAVALLLFFAFYWNQSAPPLDGSIRSIAVLPFKPLSEQDRNPALEQGMTNELIAKLASSEALKVLPFAAVARYGSPDRDAVAIGKALGVDVVLDSSLQVYEGRVHVTAVLLRVSDGKQLWTDPFDQELTHIFDVQNSISERVASTLRVKLGEHAKKRYTDNDRAYRLYQDGRWYLSKLNPADARRALDRFQQAIDLDPNYALAYTGISDYYRGLILSGEVPPAEVAPKAMAAAERAVTIDPELSEAQTNLGFNHFWYTHDWVASEAAFKKALELDPNSAQAHHHYAHFLSNLGRSEEAIREAEETRKLDGSNPFSITVQGLVYCHAGKYDQAFARFDEATALNPSVWLPRLFASIAHIDRREYQEALNDARRATELNGSQSISIAYECVGLARLGQTAEAKKVLDQLIRRSKERYVPPYHLAIAYAGLNDRAKALDWLEESYSDGDVKMVFLKADHIWDDIRTEPRFIELMGKMNFAP